MEDDAYLTKDISQDQKPRASNKPSINSSILSLAMAQLRSGENP